ncbi:casein kinase ii subunit beta [Anaeramoeba ignava]|uniref:Casein kinase II subunit beta n=1 Tax=Anaeramoeba ignava TaxID=1746090 RepID=A0A9Q0LKP4_ANAIG|nr:casein kinase ii subunit beta [Anaeramoeba ignava]
MSNNQETKETWIEQFCKQKGNEFFCEVEESFINDSFNLTGISSMVGNNFRDALRKIKGQQTKKELDQEQKIAFDKDTIILYGLIHARYIITSRGLDAMAEKFRNGEFGKCPNFFCKNQPCLPVGLSEKPGQDQLKLFCPKCQDIYYPKLRRHTKIDGAYFGPTFAHLLLFSNSDLNPNQIEQKYIPKIFGFAIHPSAKNSIRKRHKRSQNRNNQNKKNNEEKEVKNNEEKK